MTFSTKNETYHKLRRFQKCLRRATAASSIGEAEAAEAAARRLMAVYQLDPSRVPNWSVYDRTDFSDNALLLKLRQEYAVQHKKRKHKRGPKHKGPRQKVDVADHERIRVLYNEGFGPKVIGEKLGYNEHTVNTQRHVHLHVKKDWVLDNGKLQLAMKAASAA
jgi:hypothetical protein